MRTSVKLKLKNKPLSDGTYPLVLQVIKDGATKLFSTGISCSKDEWDGSELKKNHLNYQKRNLILHNKKSLALKLIDHFTSEDIDFTLSDFEQKYRGDAPGKNKTVFQHFQDRIEIMVHSGRIGNAKSYKDTCSSFFGFYQDKTLSFRNLNASLLEQYEAYLRHRGNHDSGIAFRMRTLRAIYNSAIQSDIIKKDYYPFEKYKVSKLKGKGIKKALTREEVRSILELDLSHRPDLVDAKNYFTFSYYTRGMNWADMMKLKKNDIAGDQISYIRSKTKGRFVIKVLPPVAAILNHYLTIKNNTSYVFPILLSDNLTPTQIDNRKHKTLRAFNNALKELARLAKVTKPVTSYVIRHSFATNLKQLGVSSDLISQSMGHANVDITNNYLKEFEDVVIDDANEKLLFSS